MRTAQGKIEFVFILIVLAMLASVIFLPQISQITGFASAGQENLVTIEKNLVTAINLSTYLPGVERTYLATSPSNIDVKIKDTLLVLTPDKDFTGERMLKVFVAGEEIQELVFRIEVVSKKNTILEKIKEEYEQKEEEIYIPPPEPEPEQEPEPEDIVPSNALFVSKSEKLHVDLSSYFETEGPFVSTGDIDLIVDIDAYLMTIEPYPGFIGEEEITVSSVGDELEEHSFLVKVLGECEEEPVETPEKAPEAKDKPKKNESEKQVLPEKEEIRIGSKKYGEKIEDEPGFEVYFKSIEKANETVEIIFYHDSNKSEKVYVEGEVNYTISANSSEAFESVNLTVTLDDGIVPEFELHVGDNSEKFKFGKKIPKVWLRGKPIKKNKKNETAWYKVIDRDDDLVNVLIVNGDSSVLVKGVRVEKIKGLFKWIKSTILTTEIFAADPIDMEEAIISLPRNDEVTSVVECSGFDLDLGTCPSSWITTDIPFIKTDTHINFTVNHFSAYGGGKIEVIDVQSYPSVGGTWRVRFNTTGTANLTITAINGTNWTDYADSSYDLKFLEVKCGNQKVNYTWINNSVFIPNYNCSSLGYETSKVLTTGQHALEFRFGTDVDYAYNSVFSGSYDMTTQDNISWMGGSSEGPWYLVTHDWADINGDGYADAIVGGYAASYSNENDGMVFILYGPQEIATDVDDIYTQANATWYGEYGSDYLGSCIGTGDVNNDGYDDILIGAFGYPSGGVSGRVYVVYGQSSYFSGDSIISSVANATFTGAEESWEILGLYCDTADLDGDNNYDLLMSSGGTGFSLDGITYLFYGQSTPYSGDHTVGPPESGSENASWTNLGSEEYASMVRYAGDVNNDDYDDFLIGAPWGNDGGENYPGKTYLIYGQSTRFSGAYTLSTSANATFSGDANWDEFGQSVSSAGDVDNDGYGDFIIAAPNWYDIDSEGRVYLFYGGSGAPWSGSYDMSDSGDYNASFTGPYPGYSAGAVHREPFIEGLYLGGALSYGDFNADGYSDFLIGARGADVGGNTDNGEVVLYYGKSALFSGDHWLNLTDANATFYGEEDSDYLSMLPTGMAEDVDYEHIMMSAEGFDNGGGPSCPFLYLWDGENWNFDTDIYPSGRLGIKTSSGYRPPIPYDYYVLQKDLIASDDGKFKIILGEERDEINYLDAVRLYAVEHDAGVDIAVDSENISKIYTLSDKQVPISCTTDFGIDCTEKIQQKDEKYVVLGQQELLDWHYLELDFGDIEIKDQTKLFVRGFTIFPKTAEGRNEMAKFPVRVALQVWDGNEWINGTELLPTLKPYPRDYAVDITSDMLTFDGKIRARYFRKTYIDQMYIDTSKDQDVNVTQLNMTYANLGYHGLSQRLPALPPKYNYSVTKDMRDDYYYWGGNYTKYGDVSVGLSGKDDKLVIFPLGDSISLEFDDYNNSSNYDLIFYSIGYFKVDITGLNHTVLPLPFHNMSNYPYSDNESYPYDEEHLQYLAEYNTRYLSGEHNSDEGKVYIMLGEQQAGGLTACGNISSSTSLAANISANGSCFNIIADDVTLDCKGFSIIGNGTGIGINVTSRNGVTLKNCVISNFTNSIYVSNSNQTTIQTPTTVDDIQNYHSNKTSFRGSISGDVNITDSYYINLQNSGGTRTVTYLGSITAYSSDYSKDVIIAGDSAYINTTHVSGLNASANITFSSFSSHHPYPQFALGDSSTFTNCTLLSDPKCYSYPFAGYGNDFIFNTTHFTNFTVKDGGLNCGDNIAVSVTLTQDYTCSGDGFDITANSITLDCNGHSITGSSTGTGIDINGKTGVTLTNCTVSSFTDDIKVDSSTGITFVDKWAFGNFNFSDSEVRFRNNTYSILDYINTSMDADGTDLDANVVLRNNSIFVNSTAVPGLNTTAEMTFYDIKFPGVDIKVDLNDNGTFSDCNATTDPKCEEVSFSQQTGIFVFNATHFTEFKVVDGGIKSCGVDVYASANVTSDLTQSGAGECITIKASDVVIDCNGHVINGDGPTNYDRTGISSSSSSYLTNVTVRNCHFNHIGGGIEITANNSRIYGNNFTNVGNAIYLSSLEGYSAVYNNTANTVAASFIRYTSAGGGNITNNYMRDHNAVGGIVIEVAGSHILVANNTIYDVYISIILDLADIFFGVNNVTVEDNLFNDTINSVAVLLADVDNSTFRNNRYGRSGDPGSSPTVKIFGGKNLLFENETLFDPRCWGFYFMGGTNITLRNVYINESTHSCGGEVYFYNGHPSYGDVSKILFSDLDYNTMNYDIDSNDPNHLYDAVGFENTSAGKFVLSQTLLGDDILNGTNISQNLIQNSRYNYSAELTLYNINMVDPIPQFNLGAGYVNCTPATDPACHELGYSGGTFVFNTTHFTEFRAFENGTNTPPTQDKPILNSTLGTNKTTENLTVYPQNVSDVDGHDVTNITNWFVNNKSITVLNMPFDTNSSSTAKDYSSYGNNGTVTGANWTSSGISGGAYDFDGVGTYIEIPDSNCLDLNSSLSVESWVKPLSLPSVASNVLSKDYFTAVLGNTINYRIMIDNYTYTNQFTFRFLPTGGSGTYVVNSSTIPSVGQWYHVVGVYEDSSHNISIYVNGVKENEINASSGISGAQTAYPLMIGRQYSDPAYYFNGTIDEVRIYNRSLSAEQIKAHYNSGAPAYTKIVSQETSVNDIWYAELTPNDGILDGLTLASNNVSIREIDCGDIITQDTTLSKSLTTAGDCLVIGADDVTLDCAGYSITGGGSGVGVKASGRDNVAITNCVFASFKNDILYNTTTNSRINQIDVIINITNSNNTNVTNSNITALYVTNSNNTEIINCTTANYTLTNALIFTVEDLTYGKARFLQSLTESGTSMDSDINITFNRTFVDSANEPGLNVSAEITLRNLSFASTPNIYADRNDDGIYEERCVPPTCYNLSYAGGVFLFNSTHFTSYTANTNIPPVQDTPILNSTDGYNGTNEDLTVWPQNAQDPDGGVKNVTNWYMNSSSIMVLNMPFEGGSNSTFTRDYSGNNNDGIVVNATWSNSSSYDGWGAYYFNGSAYINATADNSMNLQWDMSVAAWVNLSTLSGSKPIVTRQTLIMIQDSPYYFSVKDANLSFSYTSGGGGGSVVSGTVFNQTGKWYFVAVTRDYVGSKIAGNSTINLYVDGQLVKTGLINGFPDGAGSPTLVGADALLSSFFNGSIDEVQIYNRALSAQQVDSMYAAGTGNYNTIVSQETNIHDTWQACLTPNDRTQDGITKCSNNLTVGPRVYPTCPGNITTGIWIVNAPTTITSNVTCKIINITNNADLLVNNSGGGNLSISITAENITVFAGSDITSAGLGFIEEAGPGAGAGSSRGGAGGGHGGAGGVGDKASPAGGVYGSSFEPVALGSGGGRDSSVAGTGGYGGGAVKIVAYDTFVLNGSVISDGTDGVSWIGDGGGGGSGGSIWVVAGTLAGSGDFSADGGNGGAGSGAGVDGGGGAGGGRVVVYYNSTSWAASDFVRSGVAGGNSVDGGQPGKVGTLAFIDQTNNDIFITDGFKWQQGDFNTNAAWFTWNDLTAYRASDVFSNMTNIKLDVSNMINLTDSVWNVSSTNLTDLDPGNMYFINTTYVCGNFTVLNATNITIDVNSVINCTGSGFIEGAGPGAGGGGGGGGAGAGYGGVGGVGQDPAANPAGGVYGSSFEPVALGSGGGMDGGIAGTGGYGGGAVKIVAADTLNMSGVVVADGAAGISLSGDGGGGGSGGSIWVVAGTLAGSGDFSADGGNGGAGSGAGVDGGGGAGGGRVVVYYNSTSWAASDFVRSGVAGGNSVDGGQPGKVGTLAFIDQTNNDIFITDGFKWQQGDFNTNAAWFTWNDLTAYRASDVFSNMTNIKLDVSNKLNSTDSVWRLNETNLTDLDPGNMYFINTTYVCGNFTVLNAINITIDVNSVINCTGSGFIDAAGPGAGKSSNGGGAGAGHGGVGGVGQDPTAKPGGVVYGSSFQPVALGSGGGRDSSVVGNGGYGGGAVKINASGVLNLSGLVVVDGTDGSVNIGDGGGGGSGGSIWVVAGNLVGSGDISAAGGAGGDNPGGPIDDGGGGAGGRIIVYYNSTAWTAADFKKSDISGGTGHDGGQPGKVGTLAFIDTTNGYVNIFKGFRFQANDAAQGFLNRALFNITNAVAIYNNSVTLNTTGGGAAINVINSTVEDNGSVTASMITGALSFDSNSVINISGVLDLAYNTFSDTGAAYADGLGLILERLTFTEIAWLNTSLSNIFNLSTNALLGNKYAFVNSTEVAGLNQSANITFFGINFIYPYPKVDFEDDGTFITCPGGVCTEISYVGTTYLFNVTRFTNYTLGDNYTYPNQTTPILNSSLGTDTTNENLTVYPQNVTGAVNATLTNITDWFVNNKSLMVLKMPFNTNDSSNAKDYSPFQNNGTIINTASWTTAGISGGAYLFNGVNDFINVSDDPTLNFGNGSYSLEAWFNASAVSLNDLWIITKYDGIFGFGLFINVVSGASGNISFTADGTAGNVFFSTNGTDYRDNLWHHVVATYNPLNGSMIYVDGVLQASNATYVGYTNNTVALEIGAGGGGGPFNGTIDEVRIYNRSLTAQQVAANYNSGSPDYNTIVSQETVVNETWRACVVINDGLFDSAELCSNNLTILGPGVGNTSLLGVKFNVSDFSFASTNYVTGILDFFNTSAANTTVVLMSSMNIKKLNIPGQQNNVYTRVKVDGSTVLEELLRSVQGMDEGSTGTKPVKFSLGPGSHNITFEFRRTNRGSIEINDIDVLLGQLMTAAGNPVGSQLVNGVYSHSANNFVPAFNWTINKTVNSSTVIVTKQTLNASGTATADYYFEDLGAGVVSPYWSRWLQSVNDVGSVSGNFIEEKETLVHNHTIQSRTSANTVTVNFTILDFDLRDSSASLVNSFSATDNQTNITNTTSYGAGTHNIANKNVTLRAGSGYAIFMTSSFTTSSGRQTPTYFINSTQIPQAHCYSKKERYLSSNSDIGNAFIYTICDNLTVGQNYTFNLWLTVSAGETVVQKDESLSGFEVIPFDISTGNLPPMPNTITNPLDNSTTCSNDPNFNITWMAFSDPNGDAVTYNVSLYNNDGTFNQTINGSTAKTWQLFDMTTINNGRWLIMVEGCDPSNACSNSTSNFTKAPLTINTTQPDVNILNFRLDNQIFNASFETVNASCTNCTYDSENVCQVEQEVIGGAGTFNMSLFLNGTAVNMRNIELVCTMYDYAVNNLNGANCSGSADNSSACANWIGGGNVFRINLSNSSNFNTSLLLGNITPVANCSTVVCYLNGTWVPGDDQQFNISKQFTCTDGICNATNPNGTLRFSTDKYASIETLNPDINILNLKLDFQSFNGSFNTGSGLCSGCQYDLSNGTCQAEIEKVFGMFQNYNLSITLTTATSVNMASLSFVCRTANETVQAHPGCAGLFSAVGIGQPGCVNWVATAGRSTVLAGNAGLSIDLTNFTNITIPLGTISPTQNCKVIACEINGAWQSGDTQEFVMNKTITSRAI